ncbi:RsmD family RNA methyltransferase [Candidatus Saccharibacteria bacterium]|nr:RsmD family RNA methyltransferase [Candidatus Saccharibacteria bacterium]
MRIISGKYKNRELKSPNSSATHPMSERARLSIFNMLGPLEGKTVLDLFAGTGSLGIEALSRGATSCTFVENDRKALECLKQNLKNIENCKIIKNDVYKINLENKFDLVFIDQPYDKFDKNINYFSKFLKEDGIIIISSPEPIDESSRHYANCFITLVKK